MTSDATNRRELASPAPPTGRFGRAPRGVVLLCPGQGVMPSDFAGQLQASGADLLAAYVEELGAGAEDDPLRDYASTQAALVAIGVGRARIALREISSAITSEHSGPLVATAGHSLGELVALFAAGVVGGPQAVTLAAQRGAAFDRSHQPCWDDAAMMALVGRGVHADVAEGLLDRHAVEFANDNAADQIVVAGPLSALRALKDEAAGRGLRAVRLETTGPSHSSYVRGAVPDFRASLRVADFARGQVPVYSNLTAEPFTDYPVQLSSLLSAPVRWRETMLRLETLRPATVLDVGPGRALAKIAKKTFGGATIVSLDELVASRLAA